ncbi:hypothetical protein ABT063_02680 [Streptomyces sp. NPDC002838]|uniref:hypothetical protein n=1 Tax=Streptomyces sp. NPDC002838 TaxID=3154436 RepID=UPI003328E60C
MEQNEEIEDVTVDLSQKLTEAPEELAPSVTQLITTLQEVEDPETSPQERDGVIRSAKEIVSTLETIDDPRTPDDLREELIGIVKQVTSALEVGSDPSVPPEDRAMTILTVQRSTSALDMIGDLTTPQELRVHLINIVNQVNYVLRRSHGANLKGSSDMERSVRYAVPMGVASATISDPETHDGERKGLAETTDEASSSLQEAGDPRVSEEDRAKAQEALDEEIARMKEKLEETVSAQGLPDVPLGKASEVCTNAVFDSVPEQVLIGGLQELTPADWDTEGVKDYWKAKESGTGSLDVLAQLQNNKYDNAPFEVARLITKLAEFVPASELFSTVGTPGLHCLQSARHLDQQGIKAGTWPQMAEATV